MSESATQYLDQQPLPKHIKFMMFGGRVDQDKAVAAFVEKYQVQPAYVIRWKMWLFIGPVPSAENQEWN